MSRRALVCGGLGSLLVWGACGSGSGGGDTESRRGPAMGQASPGGAGASFRYFPNEAIWNRDISAAPLDDESHKVIAGLADAGGFGLGAIVIDFSLEVVRGDETAPMMSFTKSQYFYEPDCDFQPVPIPVGGALELEPGYACTTQSDCHLIVFHQPARRLYEMWKADIRAGVFRGGCLVVWDVARDYGTDGRGAGCTSADAAGLPIAPLLFSADEIAAGEIAHAIRFVLPNDRIRGNVYLAPATHSTSSARGGANTPPFGARLRLRAGYPVDKLPSDAARVVARALQRYGMFLADGGKKALTAQSDRFTQAKWGGSGPLRVLQDDDLAALAITDFEMIDGGSRIMFANNSCTRLP